MTQGINSSGKGGFFNFLKHGFSQNSIGQNVTKQDIENNAHLINATGKVRKNNAQDTSIFSKYNNYQIQEAKTNKSQGEGFFKFSDEGYMDIQDIEKKTEAYKKSLLEMAQGQVDFWDITGDGSIQKGEFCYEQILKGGTSDSIATFMKNNESKEISRVFDIMDLDADGSLSKKELAANYAYMDQGYAYDDKGNAILNNDGTQKIALDGKFDMSVADPEPTRDRLQEFYNTFFGQK